MNRRRNIPLHPAIAVPPRERSGGLGPFIEQHAYSALSSLGRLWQRRGATMLTVLVMALALALPLLLALALANAQRFGGSLLDSREVSVFLAPDLGADAIAAAERTVRGTPGVQSVARRTPDEGLAELRELAGFGEALDLLAENPLPTVLLAAPAPDASSESIATMAAALERVDGVELVQYDVAWRERLARTLALAARITTLLAGLLALGVLLVVGNTIRLDVESRAEEIAVVQLIGGSDGFVRRPFLYAGVWYGLAASALALLAVFVAQLALAQPVRELAESYGSAFALAGLPWRVAAGTLAGGIVLGWLGAWAACGRHLAKGRPV
ncbi:MAG TPA: permease-like cell division protein FtsX [Xanthomonadales bacterium]|nr:permease-like cell division protein FtsX [Xanthomonadales bacterium]